MNNLEIPATEKTPSVFFNATTGVLEIKGRSIPENAIEFFKPLETWLEEYSKNPQPKTVLNIHLDYFNTTSSKCLLDIFRKLEMINKSELSEVLINWYYEQDDEDMLEAGEDYQSILKIPIKMIEISG